MRTEDGYTRTLTVDDLTRIKLEDDISGKLADLRVETEVEVKFDPPADMALNIDLKD